MTAGKIFVTVLNMSLTASAAIAAVIMARLVLKRAPKWISCALWAVVLLNLLCPLRLESALSLNPLRPSPIPPDATVQAQPRPDTGFPVVGDNTGAVLPSGPPAAVSPPRNWTATCALVWLSGAGAMMAYAFASYGLLRHRLRFATKTEGGAYETDRIPSPFVLGFLHPRIFLPAGIARDALEYVMRHERTHIRRRDHLVKPLAFLALAAHWFNPLVWLAYFLLDADMEMSCDERVLKELGSESRSAYSRALLALSAGRRIVCASPLAFGEGGMKERVKNVLNFRKHSRAAVIAAVCVLAVVSVGFALSRGGKDSTAFRVHFDGANPQTIARFDALTYRSPASLSLSDFAVITVKCTQLPKDCELLVYVNNVTAPAQTNPLSAGGTQTFFVSGFSGTTVKALAGTEGYAEFDVSRTPADSWPDGMEMTLDEAKSVAVGHITMNRGLTVSDLEGLHGFSVSSDYQRVHMLYPVKGGFSLSVRADRAGEVRKVGLLRGSDGALIEITADSLEHLDEFISGAYTPPADLPWWDALTVRTRTVHWAGTV